MPGARRRLTRCRLSLGSFSIKTRPSMALSPPRTAPAPPPKLAPDIKAIIAISSGKGGVGKSTTAVNLALACAADGLKVGLLDADIYGPSVPTLLGVHDKPELLPGNRLKPLRTNGLVIMSIGLLVPESGAMIWRGPMVMQAITQLLRDVDWGPLDVLIVDMPPGTGDAALTLAQIVPLAGAVVVSTPQDMALIDARRGLAMFRRVDVPILGVIENMSFFLCPKCGNRTDIFGHGGAEDDAARLQVPFLGQIPLDPYIRETSDAGTPIMVKHPQGAHADTFRQIARRMLLNASGARKPPPRIIIED
ncbi:MAG: Mrp/NBP35 family ATP-binding protein [Hyphomicrobiales bacterium]|nr:Mrp/NBP35 family ATP-binding protein [Hyphomicrobiales bacterium]